MLMFMVKTIHWRFLTVNKKTLKILKIVLIVKINLIKFNKILYFSSKILSYFNLIISLSSQFIKHPQPAQHSTLFESMLENIIHPRSANV